MALRSWKCHRTMRPECVVYAWVHQSVHFIVYFVFKYIIDSDQQCSTSKFVHIFNSALGWIWFGLMCWCIHLIYLLSVLSVCNFCVLFAYTRDICIRSARQRFTPYILVLLQQHLFFLIRYICCCCCRCCRCCRCCCCYYLSKTHSLFLFQFRLWIQSIFIFWVWCESIVQSLWF